MIEDVAANIWILEGEPVNFYGFCYPTRAVVVRFEDDRLWVWSPIKLTPTLRADVARLGTVAYLVSPNKIHHLFLKEWADAFPEATLSGPKSTIKKRSDLAFTGTLNDRVPEAWSKELDQVWFNGSIAMDEVVFFHRASRTVILADLSENFSDDFLKENWSGWKRCLANLWGIVEGRGFAPLEWRLSFLKKRATRAARDRVLAWNPDNVIMAHGTWQKGGGTAYLEKAFSWM